MEAKKIVTREHADGNACQICGKALGPIVPGIPAAPVYAFETGGELCTECAKAIAKRTRQDIERRWSEDLLNSLYGKDAAKGGKKAAKSNRARKKKRTVYDERRNRMAFAVQRLPLEDYAVLYARWNGAWPDELPNGILGCALEKSQLDGIRRKAAANGAEMLSAAEAKLLDGSRRAWVLDGTSDLDGAFSEKASELLWAFNVRTLSDLEWFSLDAALASTGRRNCHWYELGIDLQHGFAGAIAEIYVYMAQRYGPDCACGTGLRGPELECAACYNRDRCRMRPDDFDLEDDIILEVEAAAGQEDNDGKDT